MFASCVGDYGTAGRRRCRTGASTTAGTAPGFDRASRPGPGARTGAALSGTPGPSSLSERPAVIGAPPRKTAIQPGPGRSSALSVGSRTEKATTRGSPTARGGVRIPASARAPPSSIGWRATAMSASSRMSTAIRRSANVANARMRRVDSWWARGSATCSAYPTKAVAVPAQRVCCATRSTSSVSAASKVPATMTIWRRRCWLRRALSAARR